MDFCFDTVIIDTSALENYQFDFCGWTTQTLPSFFDLLTEQSVELLNHPVLDGEIRKHISHSQLLEKVNGLQQNFQRNKEFYKLIGISPEDAIKRLSGLDVKKTLLSRYTELISSATMLPFPSPDKIFEKYFSSVPPFSENGNKKSEFPDAFIIESVCSFLKSNPYKNILVISKDGDWKQVFDKEERASFCESIDDALKMIQNTEKIESIVSNCEKDIFKAIQFQAECECYSLPEYETPEYADVEISSIEVKDVDYFTPLRITPSTILFKCIAQISVNGSSCIIDEDRSVWDHEDKEYVYISYSDISFKNGHSEIECEISIEFSPEDDDYTASVTDTKILEKYAIDIDLNGADITVDYCSDDDLALEALREDHGR